jgi:hypothetical protein
MVRERFLPGFRLSGVDVGVLVLGGVLAGWAWAWDGFLAGVVGFVVLHFFLFCNVLRMRRGLELVWAGAFVAMAGGVMVAGATAWRPWVFVGALGVTVWMATLEMRGEGYHGVGWRRVNPGLEEWFRKQGGGRAGGAGEVKNVEGVAVQRR